MATAGHYSLTLLLSLLIARHLQHHTPQKSNKVNTVATLEVTGFDDLKIWHDVTWKDNYPDMTMLPVNEVTGA